MEFFERLRCLKIVTQEHIGHKYSKEMEKASMVGDLLGRERVTGARKARASCDSPCNRYENIVEQTATWNAKQAFLGVSQTY